MENRECILKAQQQDTVIVVGDNNNTTTTSSSNRRRDNYNNRDRGYQTKREPSLSSSSASSYASSSRNVRNGEITVAGRLAFVRRRHTTLKNERINLLYSISHDIYLFIITTLHTLLSLFFPKIMSNFFSPFPPHPILLQRSFIVTR